MKSRIIVSTIQQPCNLDRKSNLDLSIAKIHQAAEAKADLVVLPELHTTPYFCQNEDIAHFDLAEPIPGPTTAILGDLSAKLKIVLVASVFEKRTAGIYHNTAVIFDKDGRIAGMYRKMHIPDDPGFYEKFYFTPGDLGFTPIETTIGKLGILICWDQWFPEAARLMALAGAELLIYPTAIGWDPADTEAEQNRQLQAWITIQRAHAIANGIPVVVSNRIGFEPSIKSNTGIKFWGNSFISGPQGEILNSANETEQTVLTDSIDKTKSEKTRQIWPYFRDRRIDEYGDLVKLFIDN